MPQISSLSFNVSFEAHNPNRVGLSNTTPSLPAGFVGIFKVTQPDGYVRNGDIDNPDVTNLVSSCYVTLVPDSAGQLQQGQYTIEFIGNAPGYLSTSFIRTFTLQYTAASISLRNDFDVFTPHLAYTDISNYNVSGYTIASGPTRNWTATSATTGAITSTNSSIDIKKNNQYYAETYVIQFGVTVSYLSQAYPWLTLSHTRSQSTTVTACVPKSLEDLTQLIEALREESNASCGGDWARFEKANSLYVHLINMLRLVLIAGQHQDGFFDVYQQLLSYLQNGSVACDSIGQVIPPYDFSDYESSIYDGQASYCQLVGDGVNTVYRVNHQLGDECVVVQVYEVATGKQVFCDLAVSTINSIDITFYEPPTLNQYRVVAVAGAIGIRGQGFQPGGLTGQLLRKRTNADFDTEWADVTVALPYLVPYTGATQSVYLGEYGVEAGFVRFDTTPTATPAVPAVMSWNDVDGTVDLRLKGNNVSLQVGQEMVARVVNKTGANLLESQYKAVRIRKVSEGGAQGQRLAVVLAQANTEFASTDMLGIVTENITNNEEGFITTFGTVRGINTTGSLQGETWADGDILFLSPTVPGGLTKVKPSAPNHLSIVGYVEYAHQNNGKIFVHVQTSWELDELHNVAISSPTSGQVLKYNGTLWVNAAIPAVTSVGLATTTPGVTITDTPVTGSGVININIATASASSNGLLSSADWATFNAKQSALTFGNISTATSGVTITNGNASTVGPNVSISIATAASGQNGLLSASDWATFNAKVGGSGTVNYVPKFTAAGTIGNSIIQDNGTDVGIGSNSAGARLEILRTATGAANNNTAGSVFASSHASGAGPSAYPFAIRHNASAYTGISGSNFVTQLVSSSTNSNAFEVYTTGSSPLVLGTSATERLRITSGGNVGIGATGSLLPLTVYNPTLNTPVLEVRGGGGSSQTRINLSYGNTTSTTLNGDIFASTTDFAFRAEAGRNLWFGTASTGSSTNRMQIFANGRVGINTTTDAGYLVNINGTLNVASNYAYFGGDSNTAVYMGSFSTEGRIGVGGRSTFPTADLTFYTANGVNNFERMRISSAGVITVANLAGSGARIVVADASGNLSATTLSSSVTTGSGTTNYITKWTGASTQGDSQIFDNGTRVGIGTASPAARLDIRGSGLQDLYFISTTVTNVENTIQSYYNNGGAWADLSTKSQNLIFNTGPLGGPQAERLRITSGGDVLIGQQSDAFSSAGRGLLGINGTSSALISLRYGGVSTGYIIGYSSALQFNSNNIPIVFSTTEVERMRIFNNGRVGINTTTDAGYQLDVNGSFRASGVIRSAAAVGVTTGFFQLDHPGVQTWKLGVFTDNTSTFSIGNDNGGTFASRYLNITNSGNVGIGTASPSARLDVLTTSTNGIDLRNAPTTLVDQTSKNSPRLRLVSSRYEGGNVDAPFSLQNVRTGSPTNDQRLAITNFGDVEVLSITNLGFVGIGTTSPNERMTIQGSASAGAAITLRGNNATSSNEMLIGQGNANESYVYNRANQPMIFGTSNTERLRIFANGRVGINTGATDAGFQFDVNGSIRGQSDAAFATGSGNVFVGATTAAISNGVKYVYAEGGSAGIGPELILHNTVAQDTASMAVSFTGVRSGAGVASQIRSTRRGMLTFHTQDLPSATPNTPAERMRIDAVGNVGIGVTPSAWSGYGAPVIEMPSGGTIIGQNSVNIGSGWYYSGGSTFVYKSTGVAASYSQQVGGEHRFYNAPAGTANNTITFTQAMTLSNSGNLGIGTANPLNRLHTEFSNATAYTPSNTLTAPPIAYFYNSSSADAAVASTIRLDAGNLTGNNATSISAVRTGNADAALTFGTRSAGSSVTERMRIFGNGRVGINTTTDSGYQLDINGNTRVTGKIDVTANVDYGISVARSGTNSIAAQMYSSNGILYYGVENSAGGYIFTGSSAYAAVIGSGANYPLQFASNNIIRMTVDGGGSVGIGVVSPSASAILQVDSTTKGVLPPRMTSAQRGAISSPANGLIVYQTDGTEGLYIKTSTGWRSLTMI